MPTDRRERRLVRARRAARATAWLERAYARHGLAVSSYAYHLTGDRDEAERLTASVFRKAHRRRLAGRGIRRPRVWLLRRLHETAPILPRDRRGELVRRLPEHDARELTTLRGQLWRLPLDQQVAFVLSRWCGLRPRDIARVLGLSPGRVRAALREAETAMGNAPAPSRRRRGAAVAVGASMALAGAQVRVGGAKALAATVPGFSGAGGAAAGAGSIPFVAAAGKVAMAAVLAATAAGAGAAIEHDVGSLGARPHLALPSATTRHGAHSAAPHASRPVLSTVLPAKRTPSPLPKHKPSHRSRSGQPSKPGPGTHRTHPTHPSHPAKPTHAAHPTHPSHPSHPSKSHKPHPTPPTHPTHPSTPGGVKTPPKG